MAKKIKQVIVGLVTGAALLSAPVALTAASQSAANVAPGVGGINDDSNWPNIHPGT